MYIYRIVFPNGKMYIGQTKDFKRRTAAHKLESIKGERPVNKAIRHFGIDSISFNIILECDDKDADYYERSCIVLYNTLIDTKTGYNLESGGNLNKTHSKTTRDKMRAKALGKIRYGRKVNQFSLDGVMIAIWFAASYADEALGFSEGTVAKACRRRVKHTPRKPNKINATSSKYRWEYAN